MLEYLALENGYGQATGSEAKSQATAGAVNLHRRARNGAMWGRIRSVFTRKTRSLLDLNAAKNACTIGGQCCTGTRTVSLSQIRGSEGRCKDFDCDFQPLQQHTRHRWIGIAAAQMMGTSMPPVELVQVGDIYFVRDGHHRISVGRALGQKHFEADITIWQVDGRLPWEQGPAADTTREEGAIELTPTLA